MSYLRSGMRTGIEVSRLGLGAGPLGDLALPDREAERVVHAAVDLGITFLDTAPSYGASEDRLGRFLGARRQRIVLSTKCGYGAPGHDDWTGSCVRANVDAALMRLRTDWIDVLHLHSCPAFVLERGEVTRALDDAVATGKVRMAAYSGDGEALAFAIRCGRFGAIQCSVNLCDQEALAWAVPEAKRRGLGVVAKRALSNGAFSHRERPERPDVATYWERFRVMDLTHAGMDLGELALRFSAFAEGVDCAIVGTTRIEHLERNVAVVARGRLDAELVSTVRAAFLARGSSWAGVV